MHRGFKTPRIQAGRNFEPLSKELDDIGVSLNCASKKESIPEIYKFNCTVKERTQYELADMLFKLIYKLMIVNLVASAIFG